MIPTPDLSHLTRKDYDNVYEPAEDTFLLLDALESDADALRNSKPIICLEVGSGSGCVSSFISKILGSSVLYLCTDINLHACRCTCLTGTQNSVVLDPITANLADPLKIRLKKSIDVIVFNPPYVPTTFDETSNGQSVPGIQSSWAGGSDGMEVTNRLLDNIENLLSEQGRFYLVALKQNDIPNIRKKMFDGYNLKSEIVLDRRSGIEHLFILRFVR